jgi:tetratricopeptide (TPR) repeat protein
MLAAGFLQAIRAVHAGHSLRAPWPWQAAMLLPRMPGEYWGEQARRALRAKKFETVIELANHALKFEQHNPAIYFHLGEANRSLAAATLDRTVRRARLEAAVSAYRNSLSLFPFDEHVLVRLGQAFDELGRFGEAREAYETALRHDPNLAVLHAYYARHLARVGRTEEAQKERVRANQLGIYDLHDILGEAVLYDLFEQ